MKVGTLYSAVLELVPAAQASGLQCLSPVGHCCSSLLVSPRLPAKVSCAGLILDGEEQSSPSHARNQTLPGRYLGPRAIARARHMPTTGRRFDAADPVSHRSK